MKKSFALVLLFLLLLLPQLSFAEKWTFAALADNRTAFASYRNVLEEVRDRKATPSERKVPIDFILGVGDLSPVEENYDLYRSVFKDRMPPFYPVMGNHETKDDLTFIDASLLPVLSGVQRHDGRGVNYYYDWKNVRVIVLDQYSDFARGMSNPALLEWLEKTIRSASADHVFIAFHEAYLPADPPHDPFWSILLDHRDKVRAVLAGHTHAYNRRKIPDEDMWGIQYINVGNAGWITHSDHKQTLIEVTIDGQTASFKVVQAKDKTKDFKLREEWSLKAGGH